MARMLSLAKVATKIDRSKPTIRAWIEAGVFPRGIVDPNGNVCWPEDVVNAWQTLFLTGFFSGAVKSNRHEKDRQLPETTGKSEG